MASSKEVPSVPTDILNEAIREPMKEALLQQLKEKGDDATYEFHGMVFKLNNSKTSFILKYRKEACILCCREGYDIERELGFEVFHCGHYNTCVTCCEDRLCRCPTCRYAFKCWWCQSSTEPDKQPASREDIFDQWGPLVWNAPSGFCGVCGQEISRELYVNRLMAYVQIDKMARLTGKGPEEFMEFVI